MSNRPILAFDCDGILSNLVPGMSMMCQEVSGKKCDPSEWIDYGHYTNLGMTDKQYLDGLVSYKVLETATAHYGAAEAITRAIAEGCAIALITARGFHPNAEDVTRAWLEQNGIHVDYLILVGPNETKIKALLSLPNVIAYVDDYLSHLESLTAAEMSIPLFLMDQPWNREDKKFSRVHSVHEFVDKAMLILKNQAKQSQKNAITI